MANLKLSDLLQIINDLSENTDAGGVSTANITTLLDETGNWLLSTYGKPMRRETGTVAFGGRFANDPFWTNTAIGFAKLLQLNYEGSGTNDPGTVDGTPLEWRPIHDIMRMRNYSTAPGVPRYWSAFRRASAAGSGFWTVLIHPPADVTNGAWISANVEYDWGDFTSLASTMRVDLTREQGYLLARLVAIQVAQILGRPEGFMTGLMKPLPAHVKSLLGVTERQLAPRPPTESVS